MIGEHFEICISEMARNALKLSTIFGEIFEICTDEMARNGLKSIHHGWRKFENFISEMARNALKLSTMVGENFENLLLKWKKCIKTDHHCWGIFRNLYF